MNQRIKQTLDFYCANEISSFKGSDYFVEISTLSEDLGFSVRLSVGESIDQNKMRFPKTLYFDVSIVDIHGRIIVVNELDNDHLCYATSIVRIDKNSKIIFSPWEDDDDFIDTLQWIIQELKIKRDFSNRERHNFS